MFIIIFFFINYEIDTKSLPSKYFEAKKFKTLNAFYNYVLEQDNDVPVPKYRYCMSIKDVGLQFEYDKPHIVMKCNHCATRLGTKNVNKKVCPGCNAKNINIHNGLNPRFFVTVVCSQKRQDGKNGSNYLYGIASHELSIKLFQTIFSKEIVDCVSYDRIKREHKLHTTENWNKVIRKHKFRFSKIRLVIIKNNQIGSVQPLKIYFETKNE